MLDISDQWYFVCIIHTKIAPEAIKEHTHILAHCITLFTPFSETHIIIHCFPCSSTHTCNMSLGGKYMPAFTRGRVVERKLHTKNPHTHTHIPPPPPHTQKQIWFEMFLHVYDT